VLEHRAGRSSEPATDRKGKGDKTKPGSR